MCHRICRMAKGMRLKRGGVALKKSFLLLLAFDLFFLAFVVLGAILSLCNYTLTDKLDERIYKEIEKLNTPRTLENDITALEQNLFPKEGRDGEIIVTFQGTLSNQDPVTVEAGFDQVSGQFHHLKSLTIMAEGRNIEVQYPTVIQLQRLLINSEIFLFIVNIIAVFRIRKDKNAAHILT